MTHLKTIAVSLIAFAAVAVPASAVDHRDNQRNSITYGVDLNLGNIRISNYSPRYGHNHARAPRVYIELATTHHRDGRGLMQFENDIRRQFSRAAQRDFRLTGDPRGADIVIRLDPDEWRKAYRHYVKASRQGRYERSDEVVHRVAARLLDRAYDIRGRDYRNVRYDRGERYDSYYDSRRDDHRGDRHARSRY